MKRYEVFRSRDPQVSFWLQKNGFQNQRSANKDEETRGKEPRKRIEKMKKATRTKEVRFESMQVTIRPNSDGKILGLRSNKMETGRDKERLKKKDKAPATMPSQDLTERDSYEMNEPTKNSYRLGNGIRSFSSPLKVGKLDEQVTGKAGLHSITRRNSLLSLSSERPSYIPVLIRNNNTRLRKYSFSENCTTTNTQQTGKREVRASERDNPSEEAMFKSNNTKLELGNVSLQQTTHIINPRRVTRGKSILHVETIRGANKYNEKRTDDQLRKEIKTCSNPQRTTDTNGNHISINQRRTITGSYSDGSDEDIGFKLNEEDSLQSYSFEMQQKAVTHNYPSSMYSARGNLLSWLGEVNKNNPQLWS